MKDIEWNEKKNREFIDKFQMETLSSKPTRKNGRGFSVVKH